MAYFNRLYAEEIAFILNNNFSNYYIKNKFDRGKPITENAIYQCGTKYRSPCKFNITSTVSLMYLKHNHHNNNSR